MQTSDIAIIGCGPAGLSAAIQLRRLGEEPVVFEASRMGGLLANAHLVENYPGFPEGIAGAELVDRMTRHLGRYAVEVVFEEVTLLADSHGGFRLVTPEREVRCRIAILASGTRPRKLARICVPDAMADRVLSEVYPIRDVRGKYVLIVGSGDAAFDYALGLAAENRVIIVNRSGGVKCLPLLWKRARGIDSIEYHERTVPTRLKRLPDGRIGVVCEAPGGELALGADYIVLAIGKDPRLDFLSDELSAGMEGYREAGLLHLIGDVRRGIMRQTAIAAGDGVRAAIEAHTKLLELRA